MADDLTMLEVSRSLLRLEGAMNTLSVKVDSALLAQAVHVTKMEALADDVSELKERERWRARAVATAVVTALVGPVMILFQVKK